MRILHLAETIKGGIASHFDEILPAQAARYGADAVRLIGPASHAGYMEQVPAALFRGFPDVGEGRLARTIRLAAATHAAVRDFRPDILHAHSSYAGAVMRLPGLLPRLPDGRRVRTVYCPHGWAFAMDGAGWKRSAYAAAERLMLRGTDAVINVSETERNLAATQGLDPAKLHVVRNGVAPAPPAAPRLDGGPVELLFVGRFSRQKGLDLLLAAARHGAAADLILHVVGEPYQGYDPTDDALPGNVRLHGWASRAEVAAYLATADALVMPSRWEGMPMTALEALRAGRAVIANDIPVLREVVTPATGMLVDATDPAAFAQALAGLDRPALAAMGRAARADWEARFTADVQINTLDRLYGTLINA